ncbi:hypothetical protein MAC_06552 [Metarhizium acridum CQMa 102]|uniref:Uncharacterized protein n=1 Tax=Metarhizium acridum (strain CQMa 102) TaxID=655827 RepID=E9E9K4_METAQ|nr:uncharacterized protein MAC_06552 [Metarhizium acridum CQMa 102]EFY87444.1 hypothetical protein MAC_06552 [Metarhizium acridum CQMa 102]
MSVVALQPPPAAPHPAVEPKSCLDSLLSRHLASTPRLYPPLSRNESPLGHPLYVSNTPDPPSNSIFGTSTPTSATVPSSDLSNTPASATSTGTPNSTPNGSEGTPPTRTPTRTSLATPIHTLLSTVISNAPIGGQTDGLTATPTASPAPPSDGPGLSPAVIATIVVSTVTVIGVPLWLIRCYRWRKSRATSPVEGNAPPKRNESVVMGYTELLGSTQMRHEMLSHTPPNAPLPLYINTIAEIDSDPLRKTPEVSPEDVSPEDAISQAMSFSTTTAVSRPEPPQAADEEEAHTEAAEDSSGAAADAEAELEMLRNRQKELERKRQYLQKIQEIDEEEARLQERIDELQQQYQPPEK